MTASSPREDRLVRIATAPNEIVAELWKGILAEDGIQALSKPLGPGGAYFTNFVNQHALFVLERDASRATQLLEQVEAAEPSVEEPETDG